MPEYFSAESGHFNNTEFEYVITEGDGPENQVSIPESLSRKPVSSNIAEGLRSNNIEWIKFLRIVLILKGICMQQDNKLLITGRH